MKIVAILLFFAFFRWAEAQDCRVQEGYASWYGGKFHGRRTSSGEIFNKYKYTAASRDYPLRTYLLVRNLENGKEVVVWVNDRGPWKKGRIIDLSRSAAERLGFVRRGVAKVQIIPLYCITYLEEIGEEYQERIIIDLLNTL